MDRFAWVLLAILLCACTKQAETPPQAIRMTDSIDALSAVGPEMLRAFNEAPLARGPEDSAVRIFYIPAFDHPFMIRHSSSGTTGTNRAAVLSGAGGYKPGTICFESSSESNDGQVQDRIADLDRAGYWQTPSSDSYSGSDGATLLIEVVSQGTYRGWKRWAPTAKGKERQLDAINLFLLEEILDQGLVGVACNEA